MRAKSLLIGTVLALCGTAVDAQWVVTDPGNLAQSIINMSDNIAHTSKTAVNTAESFAETVPGVRQMVLASMLRASSFFKSTGTTIKAGRSTRGPARISRATDRLAIRTS